MKAKVSKTVRMLLGRKWRKEVERLIGDALLGSKRKTVNCATLCYITIYVAVSKKGVTVTAWPDLLPELEECELRVEG
jgi:hypothetical protein